MESELLYALAQSAQPRTPIARIYLPATQTTIGQLVWNTANYNYLANGMSMSTAGIIVPLTGYYQVTAHLVGTSTASSTSIGNVANNAATAISIGGGVQPTTFSGNQFAVNGSNQLATLASDVMYIGATMTVTMTYGVAGTVYAFGSTTIPNSATSLTVAFISA